MTTPNAYGARITDVDRVEHPKSLVWKRITWVADGRSYTAKTFPGGDVNRQIENNPALTGGLVNIILNGRSQVVWVEEQEGQA